MNLRATETELKKEEESFQEKLKLLKKELHTIKMKTTESDNIKLKEQMDLDAAKSRFRNSAIEVEKIQR